VNKVGDCTQLKKFLYVVRYLAKTWIGKFMYSDKFKNFGDTLEKKKLTMWKRAKCVGGCDGFNLDCGSGTHKLHTECSQGNLLDSYHFEAGKRKMKDVSLLGPAPRVEDEWIWRIATSGVYDISDIELSEFLVGELVKKRPLITEAINISLPFRNRMRIRPFYPLRQGCPPRGKHLRPLVI